MTRVIITSDLHLGITREDQIRPLVARIAAEEPELTMLAGDIAEGIQNFAHCLTLFQDLPGEVGIIAGNHDVWSRGRSSQDLFQNELPALTRAAGMHWLEGDEWRRDDLAVVASLAWYDYSAADATLPSMPATWYAAQKGRYNMDAQFVDWPWSDVDFAERLGNALCERLARIEHDAAIARVLVVTHVPLVEEQMCRKPGDARWGTSNAYFGNLTLGNRVLAFPKVAAIVSGHTHIGREATIPSPIAPEGAPIHVSVIPSEYGRPAFVVVETSEAELAVSVVYTATGRVERLVNLARRGAAAGGRAIDAMRRSLWPEPR